MSTVSSKLQNALKDIAPIRAGTYIPDDNETEVYIVTNYFSRPIEHMDDEPVFEEYSVQVHLFCPSGMNSITMRKRIKKKLYQAGFTWPTSQDASDADGQHIVFECMIDGNVGEE